MDVTWGVVRFSSFFVISWSLARSNTNILVPLEDKIKTERGCSMQHTDWTTVTHHRSDLIYHVKRADWQEEWGDTDKTMAEEFQTEM